MNELINSHEVVISDSTVSLEGEIHFRDEDVKSWIIFAHGSSSSHKSIRNINITKSLAKAGFGVLLFDLLKVEEDIILENRFNISLLSERLLMATRWLITSPYFKTETPIAYFGSYTGAAAALMTASNFTSKNPIYSIVLRSGKLELLDEKILTKVFAPTLLLVGSEDLETIQVNKIATQSLLNSRLNIIPHANHLFEGPGTLEEVERLALAWFEDHLPMSREHYQQF